jgi:hypothetical protein
MMILPQTCSSNAPQSTTGRVVGVKSAFQNLASLKQKVPAQSCDQARTNWGMGVRHTLFPMLTLGAELAASFPTLFSTASGVSGLVAGPSWAFQPQDY